MARILVGIDDDVALLGRNLHRHDLVLEAAALLRRLGLLLRADRELVLLLAGDLPLLGDVLGGVAHVVAVEGVPQAVLDHGIDEFERAHLLAVAQMRGVRRHAHGFLTAGDDDVGISVQDRLIAERDRAQTGAAELVHAPRRDLDRNARRDRSLSRGILSLPGSQDLTQDDLGHALALDARARERRFDGDLAQRMARQRSQRAVERADRRTRRADNDNVVLH